LMNGKKMSKSDGNTISPYELFSGDSPHISKGYSPMVIKFFMLQSHYRSTMDLTDKALLAAEKGYTKLMDAAKVLDKMEYPGKGSDSEANQKLLDTIDNIIKDMNDDFNTPKALAGIFELVNFINKLKDGHIKFNDITIEAFDRLKSTFTKFVYDIFGLKEEIGSDKDNKSMDGIVQLLITIRNEARANKDWATSDLIRDKLLELGIQLKDGKDGTSWSKI